MVQFSMQKIAEIMVQITILMNHDFSLHIWAYFGAKRRQFSAFFAVT